ncbi:hypothetical protein [Thalassotalea fusca]
MQQTNSGQPAQYNQYRQSIEFEQQAKSQFLAVFSALKEHPTLSITCFYLLMSYLGLFYVSTLLGSFHVEVLTHLEVTDFFLAILHYPVTFIVCLVFFIVLKVCLIGDRILRRFVWYRRFNDTINKPVLGLNPLAVYGGTIFVFLHLIIDISADIVERDIRNQKQHAFTVELANQVAINGTMHTQLNDVQVIADSSKYLWVYSGNTEKVLAVPHKNVATLTPLKIVETKSDS